MRWDWIQLGDGALIMILGALTNSNTQIFVGVILVAVALGTLVFADNEPPAGRTDNEPDEPST